MNLIPILNKNKLTTLKLIFKKIYILCTPHTHN